MMLGVELLSEGYDRISKPSCIPSSSFEFSILHVFILLCSEAMYWIRAPTMVHMLITPMTRLTLSAIVPIVMLCISMSPQQTTEIRI